MSQKWRAGSAGNGLYSITTSDGTGCLDVFNGRTQDGTIVTTYACHSSTNESFRMAGLSLAPIAGSSAAFVSPMTIQSSGACAEISGNSSQTGSGLVEWTCGAATNQNFLFGSTADGYYTIQAQYDNLCLDAGAGSITTGVQVVQDTCSLGVSQKWRLAPNSDGSYSITTPDGTGCLDVYAGRTANGTIITTYACHPSSNESFYLTGASAPVSSQTAPPSITPGAGTYTAPLTITMTPTAAGTLIYYTIDGSTPTASSIRYSSPITLNTSATVKAIALVAGSAASPVVSSTYVVQPAVTAAPAISPSPGTYPSPLSVSITPQVQGTPMYYTIDGSSPTTGSSLYSGTITLTSSATVRAIAVAAGSAASPVASSAFTLQQPQTPAPTISPASGTYPAPLGVSITAAVSGTPIYYTLDGSTPTTSSSLYTGVITLKTSAVVKAIGVASASSASPVVSSTFTLQQPQTGVPTISPAAGTYSSRVSVTITPAIPGTPIFYTLDGSTPTTDSAVYSGAITVTAAATVKAIAVAAGSTASAVAASAFTVNTAPASGNPTSTMVIVSSGSCVDISGGSSQSGVGVDQWTCTGAGNQQFIFTRTSDGYYTIQAQSDNFCLDAGPSVLNAIQVIQSPCSGSISQKWNVIPTGTGPYVVSTYNGQGCLDVYAGRTANGTMVTTYPCHTASNEQFILSGFTAAASNDAGAPVIFNYSSNARPGDVIYVQGANLDATSQVLLGTSAASSATPLVVLNRVGTSWLAAQIPASWSGPMMLWVSNSAGTGSAVKLNGAIPLHLDTVQLVPGGAFRVLGRNLKMAGYAPVITVDGSPAAINVAASTENMLVANAPLNLSPTSASVIQVDNGNGNGPAKLDRIIAVVPGSGDPFNVGVGWGAGFVFAARTVAVSTPCNGGSDDSGNIQNAINSAALTGGVVQLPAGNCVLANSLTMRSNVVLQGAGKDVTFLRYQSNYPIAAQSLDLVGLRNFTLVNAGSTQEGLLWKQNTRSFIQNVKIQELTSRQLFLTENTNFVVSQTDFIQTGSIGGQNPFLLSNCAGLVFANNTSTTVDGSPTFVSIHDALVLNNHFTRNAVNQNESVVITTHQLVMDFAYRTSIIGNTFDVSNGPVTNRNRNDGETLLTEGGGGSRTENLGSVVSATSTTLSDPNNTLNVNPFGTGLPENYGVSIVGGTGAGQTREVVGYSGGTMQVDHPWDVTPDSTSKYATFVWGLEKSLIQGNTLIGNPRGIWLYQTAIRDVDISGNTIVNGGGIFLRTYQSQSLKQFDPMYNVRVANNSISNSQQLWMSYMTAVFVNKDIFNFGTADIGIDVNDNTLTANLPNVSSSTEDYASAEGFMNVMRSETAGGQMTSTPMLLGTIFQADQCFNCNTAYVIGTGDYGTVLSSNTNPSAGTPNFLSDWQTLGNAIVGSLGTVIR